LAERLESEKASVFHKLLSRQVRAGTRPKQLPKRQASGATTRQSSFLTRAVRDAQHGERKSINEWMNFGFVLQIPTGMKKIGIGPLTLRHDQDQKDRNQTLNRSASSWRRRCRRKPGQCQLIVSQPPQISNSRIVQVVGQRETLFLWTLRW
jgi:hypothetical protein